MSWRRGPVPWVLLIAFALAGWWALGRCDVLEPGPGPLPVATQAHTIPGESATASVTAPGDRQEVATHASLAVVEVLERDSGEPVRGALVLLEILGPREDGARSSATDQGGMARFEVAHGSLVTASCANCAVGPVLMQSASHRLQLRMHLGHPLRIQVVDRNAVPVAGAEVYEVRRRGIEFRAIRAGATDNAGMLTIPSPDSRSLVQACAKDLGRSLLSAVRPFLAGQERDPAAVLVLTMDQVNAVLTGLVADAAGASITGVHVTAGTRTGTPAVRRGATSQASSFPIESQTDDAGRFRIDNLHAGLIDVAVHAEGYVPTREVIDLTRGSADVVLRLVRGVEVTGTVRDGLGHSCSGARIRVAGDPSFPEQRTVTDAVGRFRFAAVAAGSPRTDEITYPNRRPVPETAGNRLLWLEATHPVAGSAWGRSSVDGRTTVDWTAELHSPITVTGTIVDEDAHPVLTTRVALALRYRDWINHRQCRRDLDTAPDTNGRYTLLCPAPGAAVMTCSYGDDRDALPAWERRLDVAQSMDVDIQVPGRTRLAALEGRLVDRHGRPVEYAVLCLVQANAPTVFATFRAEDGTGRFRIADVPPGEWLLHGSLPIGPSLAPLGRFQLAASQTLAAGDVVLSEKHGFVTLRLHGNTAGDWIYTRLHREGGVWPTTVRGQHELVSPALVPGDYTVVHAGPAHCAFPPLRVTVREGETTMAEVLVKHGRLLRLRVQRDGQQSVSDALGFVLLDERGSDVGGGRLEWMPDGRTLIGSVFVSTESALTIRIRNGASICFEGPLPAPVAGECRIGMP